MLTLHDYSKLYSKNERSRLGKMAAFLLRVFGLNPKRLDQKVIRCEQEFDHARKQTSEALNAVSTRLREQRETLDHALDALADTRRDQDDVAP